MSYCIYIHDGRAHMDELLACALYIIGRNESPLDVFRVSGIEATKHLEKATDNPQSDSVFIDCAEHYKPEHGFFDHHQDASLPSAAKLVFDEYFSDLENTELFSWVNWVSDVDTKGPKIIDALGIDKDIFTSLNGGQKIILLAFEHAPLDTLKVFVEGLKDKISFEKKIKKAHVWLEANSQIVDIQGYRFLEVLCKPPPELVRAVHSAESSMVDDTDVIAVYGFAMDEKNVRTFFRTHKGNDTLDFTKSTPSETVFCHNNGFLLKFRPADASEWVSLMKQSLIVTV